MRASRWCAIGTGFAAAILGTAPDIASADSGAGSAGWPIYGHDLANSRNAGRHGPSPSRLGSLKQEWAFQSSTGDFTGTPVVDDGVLVDGNNAGWVYALDPSTGQLLWSQDIGQPINGSAAIDPRAGLVFVPVAELNSPRLVALSLSTGAVRWDVTLTQQPGADVFGSPTYWRHTVYIGTSGPSTDSSTARGSLVALDETTGHVRWQTFTVPPGDDGGAIWSTPAIDARTGHLYVGTGNAYHPPAANTTDSVIELSSATGRILDSFQAVPGDTFDLQNNPLGPDFDFGASPQFVTGTKGQPLIGEGDKNGVYYALSRHTMQPVWETSIGPGSLIGGFIGSTAYDGSQIYGTDSLNGDVSALGSDGTIDWSSADHAPVDYSPVAVANGVLYTVDPTGFLVARSTSTGTVLNSLPLGAPSYGGISLAEHNVYVSVGTGPSLGSTTDHPGSIVAFGDTSSQG
jgi:polyvinyl alcohol dehydrogenase (cytochrome)